MLKVLNVGLLVGDLELQVGRVDGYNLCKKRGWLQGARKSLEPVVGRVVGLDLCKRRRWLQWARDNSQSRKVLELQSGIVDGYDL